MTLAKKLFLTTTAVVLLMMISYVWLLRLWDEAERSFPRAMTQSFPRAMTGHALALDYWEQQTSGSRNLQSLQCWAAQYNLSVVEPVVAQSLMTSPLNRTSTTAHRLWFRDLYDIEEWNSLSSKLNHSHLVSWDDFLSSASPHVILVSVVYANATEVGQNLREPGMAAVEPSQRMRTGCSSDWTNVKQFLYRHHFHVVREICFNFAFGDSLSKEEFEAHLFGSLSPSSCTVVFSQWRGTGPPPRVLMELSQCNDILIHKMISLSQGLLLHAQHYQTRSFRAAPYIAVAVRFEKLQLVLEEGRKTTPTLAQCLRLLLEAWREVRNSSGLTHTLLMADMGTLGSGTFANTSHVSVPQLDSGFRKVFREIYGSTLTVEEWENSLRDMAVAGDRGYVAALQKVLISQAKCVVLMGGGAFQHHAYSLYLKEHPQEQEQCVRVVKKCTYTYPYFFHH